MTKKTIDGNLFPRKYNKMKIGKIGNYYGSLNVKKEDGKYFWSIENYNGFFWEEIPESLYNELIKFQKSLKILLDKEDY